MLKLKQGFTPAGEINGINTVFTTDEIIGSIQSVTVDGSNVKGYKFEGITLTLDVAPITSLSINFFHRSVNDIRGDGDVTLGDLKDGFYSTIGRVNADGTIPQNIMNLYPESLVKDSLRKSLKRITNKTHQAERKQQYSIKTRYGSKVIDSGSEDTISLAESISQDVAGMFMVGQSSVIYDYYSIVDNGYQVRGGDVAKSGDRVIIGQKVPYGVNRISSVSVNGCQLGFMSEDEFTISTTNYYTVIRNWQGEMYLFLPYTEDTAIITVKYVPDMDFLYNDADIIDLQEEYMELIILDTAYRLLRDKEDERWQVYKNEVGDGINGGLLHEYQAHIKSRVKRKKATIGFASTYK